MHPPGQPRKATQREDALSIGLRIARGSTSALQVMQATLRRIAEDNPRLNAVAHLDAELGLRGAAAVDAELAACRTDDERAALQAQRPFLGVPLLLKDLATAAVDLPSRMGSRLGQRVNGPLGAGLHWPVDASLVTRYRQAGFIPFGRSTSPEMGISPSTEALAYGGPTRNPYDTARSPGGSSGGAASAIASGMVAIAHASDGAGSIRIPASCCGLIGLKPSRGLVPAGPLFGEGWGGLAVEHMLTTSTRDCAAALLASAGGDAGAPHAAPGSLQGLMDALHRADAAPRLRIGLCDTTFDGDPVHPEVARAVRHLAARLEALGHSIEPARPPIGTLALIRPLAHVVACGTSMAVARLAALHGPIARDELEPVTWGAVELGQRVSGAEYLEHLAQLHAIGRRMVSFFEQHDLLLTPVLAEPPPLLGHWAMHNPAFKDFLDYRIGPEGLWRYSPFAPLANATGGASIALPAGWSSGGLPIGAMLTGQLGDDALLLGLSAELEAAGD